MTDGQHTTINTNLRCNTGIRRTLVCEGDLLVIRCPPGHPIYVRDATPADLDTCPHTLKVTDAVCMETRVRETVGSCDGLGSFMGKAVLDNLEPREQQ